MRSDKRRNGRDERGGMDQNAERRAERGERKEVLKKDEE
jgi:hypothetical protein